MQCFFFFFPSSFSQLCLETRKLVISMILPFENSSPIPSRREGRKDSSCFLLKGGRKINKEKQVLKNFQGAN